MLPPPALGANSISLTRFPLWIGVHFYFPTVQDSWQIRLQSEFTQGRVIIRPPSQWPMILALGFFDWEVVDAGNASAHQSLLVKFPVLVAIAAKPIAAVVMPFVSKPYGDTVFAKCPDFLDQEVVNAGNASAHQSLLVKFPVLVAIAAKPIAAVVMPFVSDTVFA